MIIVFLNHKIDVWQFVLELKTSNKSDDDDNSDTSSRSEVNWQQRTAQQKSTPVDMSTQHNDYICDRSAGTAVVSVCASMPLEHNDHEAKNEGETVTCTGKHMEQTEKCLNSPDTSVNGKFCFALHDTGMRVFQIFNNLEAIPMKFDIQVYYNSML